MADDRFGESVAFLRANAKRCGVFLDFDGVIAPIVNDPEQSRPLPGMVDALNAIADRYANVALISGRPADVLRRLVPTVPTVRVFGLYGLERIRNGEVLEDARATQWRGVVADGATLAEGQLPRGVNIERKGMSFVLHYRTAPELADVAEAWAADFADRSQLDAHRGRMAIEIGPFHGMSKGVVVEELADELKAACFIGDDAADLEAFRALDRAEKASGLRAVKVAVRSNESPKALLDEATVDIAGPHEVLELLRYLGEV
jgi:trehalose 6-phosphate phosphatase